MLEKKKKITKKEMKKDPLVTNYYKAYNFYQENQAKIFIGVAAVALIIIAIILVGNQKSSNNIIAASLLAKVVPLYEQGLYEDAINGQSAGNLIGLKEIVDKYGSTEYGETAKIYLANAYLFLNKNQEAFEIFKDYNGSNLLFKATALAGRAGYFEMQEDFSKAADLYRDAARVDKLNPSNPQFLLRASINLIKAGKKQEAKKILDNIKTDYKNSTAAQEVDRYLVQVES